MRKSLNVMSLASRLLSFRAPARSVLRSLYISRCSASSTAEEIQEEKDFDMSEDVKFDQEATVYEDIETDDTLKVKDFFGVEQLFTVRNLFEARAHYGHTEESLNKGMKQFVFGIRSGQVIFDLDITAYHLRKALNVAAQVALRGGLILFVSRMHQNSFLVEETAKLSGEFAHTRKWMSMELTNADLYYNNVTRLPDLLIFLSTLSELRLQHQAVVDAAKMNIPTIGIVDSNCCPNLITYPVPGNDDSSPAVELYCNLFKEAILLGKSERTRRMTALDQSLAEDGLKQPTKMKRSL